MWRPKNWDRTHKELFPKWNTQYWHGDFEAGANAMLDALRTGATRVNNMGDPPQGKGVTVFIPDEEEQDGNE